MTNLPRRGLRLIVAITAITAILLALLNLFRADQGVRTESLVRDGTPITVFRSSTVEAAPVILIAHGFAGSQQLMQPFAVTLARNGYIAVTFDFAGHGRNPTPLSGSITHEDGATRTLVEETARVAGIARPLGDGRIAVLGHSMATDIIVRFAQSQPDVAATIAVSMFSPAVTATTPRNLLMIAGDWETTLKQEALRVAGLTAGSASAEPGVTYGNIAEGSARRVAFVPYAEHVSVLYNAVGLREALAWLDATFGKAERADPSIDGRGQWVLLLLFGVILFASVLFDWLPVVAAPPIGAGLGWRAIAVPLVMPGIATPVLLWFVPTGFLSVPVGDYLAVHFAAYGLITAGCVAVTRGHQVRVLPPGSLPRLLLGSLAMIVFGFVGIVWPLNTYVTSFVPDTTRLLLFLAMVAGTLCFFLSDEWLTRGERAAPGAFLVSKLIFLASLALAVALDFQRLFFLLIIVPVIVCFFLAYGLLSHWAYRRTGHPFVAGIANAVAFAWAIAVTFPVLAR